MWAHILKADGADFTGRDAIIATALNTAADTSRALCQIGGSQAAEALRYAQQHEQEQEVQSWISRALSGEFKYPRSHSTDPNPINREKHETTGRKLNTRSPSSSPYLNTPFDK